MCGRLAVKLAADLPVTVSPVDGRTRTGEGVDKPLSHCQVLLSQVDPAAPHPQPPGARPREGPPYEGALPYTNNVFVPQRDNAFVPAPTHHLLDFFPPTFNLQTSLKLLWKAAARLQGGRSLAGSDPQERLAAHLLSGAAAAAAASPAVALF